MIQAQTVLVLGAGASLPYGFPSGALLRELILRGLGITSKPIINEPSLVRLFLDMDFKRTKINDFRDSLQAADPPSVDVFLEGRPDLKQIGKAAIAAALIPYESEKALFTPWVVNTPEIQGQLKHRWYNYFANTVQMKFDTWGLQPLTILTYNYDRSLDHYLWMKLCKSTAKGASECWAKFKEIPIIHLHGELGEFEPLKASTLKFGSPVNPESVKRAAAAIRIIYEVQADKQFQQAQDALDKAEVVCFLGFGYAAENMTRLKWTERRNLDRPKTVGGTVYKLTTAEKRRLQLGRYFNVLPEVPSDWDVLEFLRQTRILG